MHGYISLESLRRNIIAAIAIVAYSIATAFHNSFGQLAVTYSWLVKGAWLTSIATPTIIFAGLFYAINNVMWKTKAGQLFCASDFSGVWSGSSSFEFENKKQESKITITIDQTWTSLQVEASTPSARSLSKMASIDRDTRELRYEFVSENIDPGAAIPIHRGVGFLHLSRDNRRLTGGYYTQLAETRNGKLALVRSSGTTSQ